MQCNLGKPDRTVRLVLGIGLLAVGAYDRSWWGLLGLPLLLNATLGVCGLYRLLGISTVKRTTEPSSRVPPR